MHSCSKHRTSLRIFLIHYIRLSVMDLKMPVWCLLCALFLCNSKHPCPWSYSSAFKQLCAVYSPHNLWKLKYQSLLIPTKSKCKIQAVCLLFRETASENWKCAHTGGYWVATQENHMICAHEMQCNISGWHLMRMELSAWVAIHLDLE